MKTIILILQVLLAVAVSPLLSGFIRKVKNNLRMRKGAGVFQPYFNFFKTLSKEESVSVNASWIFRIAPYIVFASALSAAFLVPAFGTGISLNRMGDIFVFLFVLALGRFFIALAGLDTASAFGGMGSSREMFVSSLVEPVALLSLFVIALNSGSSSFTAVTGFGPMHLSSAIAAIALFVVVIAETSRLPVDNQETHLELTMIHEAMVLEYSGRSLALIELASHIKQIVFFSLLADIIFPWSSLRFLNNPGLIFAGISFYCVKIAVIALCVAVVEVSLAKMRLFRVVDFLGLSFVLSIMAGVIQALGM
ncbi:MAG: NADH-quinone oxidoreductase subunit H [Candidatus Omnitrophica bacterium]|nr:NADH-quinone oxidoreductase subunit H [Candidatus Omnitrophota bacterium]